MTTSRQVRKSVQWPSDLEDWLQAEAKRLGMSSTVAVVRFYLYAAKREQQAKEPGS